MIMMPEIILECSPPAVIAGDLRDFDDRIAALPQSYPQGDVFPAAQGFVKTPHPGQYIALHAQICRRQIFVFGAVPGGTGWIIPRRIIVADLDKICVLQVRLDTPSDTPHLSALMLRIFVRSHVRAYPVFIDNAIGIQEKDDLALR